MLQRQRLVFLVVWSAILPAASSFISQRRRTKPPLSSNYNAAANEDDLTKEELELRFSDVLDHYSQSQPKELEQIKWNLLSTRLPDLHLNRCFVAASSIPGAGLGVFANRHIRIGELITLFPGDALLLWNKKVGDIRSGLGVQFGQHVTDRDASRVSSNAARSYELKIADAQSIVADPKLADEPAYIGHLINDGCMLSSKGNAARTKYSQGSADCRNAAFFDIKESHYMVVATKDIRNGEEIFASYGEGYWMSRIEEEDSSRQKKVKGRGFSRT